MIKNAIDNALKTWYPTDHLLHRNPRHPAIKLAGEAGEILDLYGKSEYKPRFDWFNCKHCKLPKDHHPSYQNNLICSYNGDNPILYTSLILDELGDWFYYWRILVYIDNSEALNGALVRQPEKSEMLNSLLKLYELSGYILHDYYWESIITTAELVNAYQEFINLLEMLKIPLEQVIQSNYIKLNSDATNHGWANA